MVTFVNSSDFKILEIRSKVPYVALDSLSISPKETTGGLSVTGTVSLYEAVNKPTKISLQAFDPAMSPNGPLPGIGWPSSGVVQMPSSVTIPAGQQSAIFHIKTTKANNPRDRRMVRIAGRYRVVRVATLNIVG
jgi:hypothetical protein